MGVIGSKLARPLKKWNIENRAQKVISQDKPIPAPTYDSKQKQIDIVNKLEPDYKTKAQKKDSQLDDYLKKVFVTSNSTEVQEIDYSSNLDRPLPKDKLLPDAFPMGHYEPADIKPGKISLSQGLQLLTKHKEQPEKYTVECLAAEYKLEKEVVANILEYYKLFNVYNKIQDYNQDIVVSTVPISQQLGIGMRYMDDDEEDPEEVKLRKMFRKPSEMPIEDEKKKSSS